MHSPSLDWTLCPIQGLIVDAGVARPPALTTLGGPELGAEKQHQRHLLSPRNRLMA